MGGKIGNLKLTLKKKKKNSKQGKLYHFLLKPKVSVKEIG